MVEFAGFVGVVGCLQELADLNFHGGFCWLEHDRQDAWFLDFFAAADGEWTLLRRLGERRASIRLLDK